MVETNWQWTKMWFCCFELLLQRTNQLGEKLDADSASEFCHGCWCCLDYRDFPNENLQIALQKSELNKFLYQFRSLGRDLHNILKDQKSKIINLEKWGGTSFNNYKGESQSAKSLSLDFLVNKFQIKSLLTKFGQLSYLNQHKGNEVVGRGSKGSITTPRILIHQHWELWCRLSFAILWLCAPPNHNLRKRSETDHFMVYDQEIREFILISGLKVETVPSLVTKLEYFQICNLDTRLVRGIDSGTSRKVIKYHSSLNFEKNITLLGFTHSQWWEINRI